MEMIIKDTDGKVVQPYAFTKKQIEKGSCSEKAKKANELLRKTVLLKNETAGQ